MRIVRNALLLQIMEDEEHQLETVLFKLLDIPDEEEDEDELEGIDEEQQQEQPERDSKMSSGNNGGADGESVEGDGENKSQGGGQEE